MAKRKNNHEACPVEEQPVVDETITPIPVEVDEPVVVEAVTEPKTFTGVVIDCRKLNVREQMNTGAKILCDLPVSSEVQVCAEEHHDEWYHVFTASGIEGFCMKKYISIKS